MRRILCDGCDDAISERERETLDVLVRWNTLDGERHEALDLHGLECLRRWTVAKQVEQARERAAEVGNGKH